MTGVEILASTQVVTKSVFNWEVFWIVLVVFAALGFFIGYIMDNWRLGLILGLLVGVLYGFIAGVDFVKPVEYTNQHKVIISEDVSMLEFTEKYEIVGTEGEIYIVNEKNEGGK